MKINKILFSITMACILAPAVAFAGVYFLVDDKSDNTHVATNKSKPCSVTHPIRTCPDNKTLTEPCGLTGESASWFKKCECDTDLYNFKPEECRDNKSLIGKSCNGKYEGCDCDNKYKYFNTTVGENTTSNCEFPKLATAVDGCAKNSDPDKELYKDCSCPRVYNQACTFPYVGAIGAGTVGSNKLRTDRGCDNLFQACMCDTSFKPCAQDGVNSGGKGESCTDSRGTFYKKCYIDYDKMTFSIVDGMKQGTGKTCDSSVIQNGIPNAEVIFRKNQETTVFAKADLSGLVSTHVPFGITSDGTFGGDDESVTIEIKAEGYATLISTCPCRNEVYPIIPIESGNSAADATIVLSWNNTISDLDSQLVRDDGKHLYYSAGGSDREEYDRREDIRSRICEGSRCSKTSTDVIARLDVDDVDCWGPETINIPKLEGRSWTYGVQKYIGSGALRGSSATVYVYVKYGTPQVFKINNTGDETLWSVFNIDRAGKVKSINKYKNNGTGKGLGVGQTLLSM